MKFEIGNEKWKRGKQQENSTFYGYHQNVGLCLMTSKNNKKRNIELEFEFNNVLLNFLTESFFANLRVSSGFLFISFN